jgi:hypothetical protein
VRWAAGWCGPGTRRRSVVAVAVALAAVPAALSAQTPGTLIGAVGGWVQNRQVWSPSSETERVGGILLGAFLRAATPADWLSVQAEALWTQRGGEVFDDVDGQLLQGSVRSDYLTVAVHPRASLAWGPLRVHLVAGPTLDQPLRSRFDPSLRMVLENEAPTVFGVSVGAGLGTVLAGQVHAEVEARVFEGLGDAYSGSFVSVRNRSIEILGRVGMPLRRP